MSHTWAKIASSLLVEEKKIPVIIEPKKNKKIIIKNFLGTPPKQGLFSHKKIHTPKDLTDDESSPNYESNSDYDIESDDSESDYERHY